MFYPYIDSLSVEGCEKGKVNFVVEGSQSYDGGERNGSIDITVTKERAKEIRDDLNSLLEDE